MLKCFCPRLTKGNSVILSSVPNDSTPASEKAIHCSPELLNKLSVGSLLAHQQDAILKIIEKKWLKGLDGVLRLVAKAEILVDFNLASSNGEGTSAESEFEFTLSNKGYSLAWITLSDKGARGEREDKSGPLIEELVKEKLELNHVQGYIIPDEASLLRALITDLALVQGYDLILTTGGTGVGPRDITPETMDKVLDRELRGFSTAMLMASLAKTAHAVISRAKAGLVGNSLVINLPGSPKAVAENLAAVLPALAHTIDKAKGDPSDCANIQHQH